jgi:hypothetical protein
MGQKASWVLPTVVHPSEYVCYQVKVPKERQYIGAFFGAILSLVKPYHRQNDTGHTAIEVGNVWGAIFDDLINQQCPAPCPVPTIRGEELIEMSPFRIDCDCNLWITCCDGSEKQILNKDQVTALIAGGNSQGAPQPVPGSQQCYTGRFQANGQFLIPVPVSTGDVIDLTAITGAGTDGTTSWFCPDGLDFFAGACVGVTHLVGGDPVPTSPHMSMIVKIGSNYYPISPGAPLTVPAGVSLVQPIIQVNDATLSDNFGEYTLTVCVRNNAATIFTHVFDFQLSPCGFVQWNDGFCPDGVWVPGIGWTFTDAQGTNGAWYRGIGIERSGIAPAVDIDTVEWVHDYINGGDAYGGQGGRSLTRVVGGTIHYDDNTLLTAIPTQNNIHVSNLTLINAVDTIRAKLYSSIQVTQGALAGSCTITKLTVSGPGADPF